MRPHRWSILVVLAGVACASVVAVAAAPASAAEPLPTIHDRTLAAIGARAYAQQGWPLLFRRRVVTELAAAGSESCTGALRAGLRSGLVCFGHLRNLLFMLSAPDQKTLLDWARAYTVGLYNRLARTDPTFLTPAKGKLRSTTRGWKALQLIKRGDVWASHSLPVRTPVPGSHVTPQPAGALNFWMRAWTYMS